MNEKKRLEFQSKMISRQSKQIEDLKSENEKLRLQLREKDELINSVSYLKDELSKILSYLKKQKEEYKKLIDEIRKMKSIINQEVYKGRWWLIKLLLK